MNTTESLVCHERLSQPPPPPPAPARRVHNSNGSEDDLGLDGIRSFEDQNLIQDDRVLRNVLRLQPHQKIDYFQNIQTEIKPHMRKIVLDWMLEVCDEQGCQPEVFSLAVNYLDRVLTHVPLKKSQFQLLACVCLFLASKFKETVPLPADKLVVYADFSVTVEEITTWEILVLEILGWDLSIVTPYCILEQILRRIDPEPNLQIDLRAIRSASQTLISLVVTEFSLYSSMGNDMLAVSCLLAAFNGMKGQRRKETQFFIQDLTSTLSQITQIPEVDLARCQFEIASYVQGSMNNNNINASNSSPIATDGGSKAKYTKLTSSASSPALCVTVTAVEGSQSKAAAPGETLNTTPTDLMDISVC